MTIDDDLVVAECDLIGLTLDDLIFVLKRKEHGPERRTLWYEILVSKTTKGSEK
jgi:hypothetical protein